MEDAVEDLEEAIAGDGLLEEVRRPTFMASGLGDAAMPRNDHDRRARAWRWNSRRT
jgi:hypothetical protein